MHQVIKDTTHFTMLKKWIQLSPMTSFWNNYIFVTRSISNDSIYKLPSCSLLLTQIFLVAAQAPLLHQTPTQFWVAEEAENKQMIHHHKMYIVIMPYLNFRNTWMAEYLGLLRFGMQQGRSFEPENRNFYFSICLPSLLRLNKFVHTVLQRYKGSRLLNACSVL